VVACSGGEDRHGSSEIVDCHSAADDHDVLVSEGGECVTEFEMVVYGIVVE
jgi:hypothetical protein